MYSELKIKGRIEAFKEEYRRREEVTFFLLYFGSTSQACSESVGLLCYIVQLSIFDSWSRFSGFILLSFDLISITPPNFVNPLQMIESNLRSGEEERREMIRRQAERRYVDV